MMKWHSKTKKPPLRGFLCWLEKLEHFDNVFNDDQRHCPEKLAFRAVRLHGSRWRKAQHFSHLDTLDQTDISAQLEGSEQTEEATQRIVLFHFMPISKLMRVRMD